MNREDFTEGSVEQVIFDYWDGKTKDLEQELTKVNKKELVEFIAEVQSKGLFEGYCHD
jgi:hypothetical protein